MKEEPFAAGDVVKLKSGGPLMTVTCISEKSGKWANPIDVCWFPQGAPKPELCSFPASALEKVTRRRGPLPGRDLADILGPDPKDAPRATGRKGRK